MADAATTQILTQEELSMGMFDELIVTTFARDEFGQACEEFAKAEKRFCKINRTVRLDVSADVTKWFDALEQRYLTEKKVWQLFTAGDHLNPRTGRLYLKFREALLSNGKLPADA